MNYNLVTRLKFGKMCKDPTNEHYKVEKEEDLQVSFDEKYVI